jgi:acetylglutamate kinase
VLDENGRPIASLTAENTEALIESGVIRDGMIPKVRTALNVVTKNAANVRIVNLAGLAGMEGTVFSR